MIMSSPSPATTGFNSSPSPEIEYRAKAHYQDGSWMIGRAIPDVIEAAFQAGLFAADFPAHGGGKIVLETRADGSYWVPIKTVEV